MLADNRNLQLCAAGAEREKTPSPNTGTGARPPGSEQEGRLSAGSDFNPAALEPEERGSYDRLRNFEETDRCYFWFRELIKLSRKFMVG